MDRLVLIDAHAIIHRAYHALPPLTNSRGEQIGAVYGFASMLLRVIQNLKPTHLAVAFDRPKPTFRKELFADYQAHRPKLDDELIPQIELVHKLVDEVGIPIFEMDGYEADDVIGTLAKKVTQKWETRGVKLDKEVRSEKSKYQNIPPQHPTSHITHRTSNLEVVIVTGDRDLLQLVNNHVRVFMPVKGLADGKLFGENEVEEKFAVKPSQIVDYKALTGDASDNYPGVPGIGPKTASDLLQKFKTLEALYHNLDKVTNEKVRQKLAASRQSAELAKTLATIVTEVPIEIEIQRCKLPQLDRPDLYKIFEELGFRSLIPRLSSDNTTDKTYNIKHITYNIEHKTKDIKQKETNTQQATLF